MQAQEKERHRDLWQQPQSRPQGRWESKPPTLRQEDPYSVTRGKLAKDRLPWLVNNFLTPILYCILRPVDFSAIRKIGVGLL